MTEQELRALVRDAIAKVRDDRSERGIVERGIVERGIVERGVRLQPDLTRLHQEAARHASHVMFSLSVGADGDGACVIEPAVPCTHCGYCKSYGH